MNRETHLPQGGRSPSLKRKESGHREAAPLEKRLPCKPAELSSGALYSHKSWQVRSSIRSSSAGEATWYSLASQPSQTTRSRFSGRLVEKLAEADLWLPHAPGKHTHTRATVPVFSDSGINTRRCDVLKSLIHLPSRSPK